MRPVRITINTAGYSQWIPLDTEQSPFNVGIAVAPWSTATGQSYTVQHTFDSVDGPVSPLTSVSWAGSGTTVTVVDNGPDGLGHGLSTNDCVIIKGSALAGLDTPVASVGKGDIGAAITVTGNTGYTFVTPANNPSASAAVSLLARVTRLRAFNCDLSNLVAASTRQDGNYAVPITAVRLYVATLTGGAIDFFVTQGGR